MQRVVTSEMDLTLGAEIDLVFVVAAHASVPLSTESLTFELDGVPVDATELVESSGTRVHRLHAGPGALRMRYRATVEGRAPEAPADDLDLLEHLRPSRYAESDTLFGQARRQFGALRGVELLDAVREHVAGSLAYTPGSTTGTDSAVTALGAGRGVCRDFTHATIALLRAMDVPARYSACYAPGLRPMDFHAVAEAYVDGAWHVVDATGLSDRGSLVRIASGRDAADCAFLSYYGGYVGLDRLMIDAWVETDGGRVDPAPDDGSELVRIR